MFSHKSYRVLAEPLSDRCESKYDLDILLYVVFREKAVANDTVFTKKTRIANVL